VKPPKPLLTKLAGFTISVATLTAVPAHAASFKSLASDLNYSLESLMDHVMPRGVTDLRLGVGAAVVPKFEGDNSSTIAVVPVLSGRYKDLLLLDGSQLRINLLNLHNSPGPHPFSAGPLMRLDFGRHESDSDDLKGLGDIGDSFQIGGFAQYTFGPARVRTTVRQDITNGKNGLVATFDSGMILYRNSKVRLAAQTGVTWGNARHMRSFYGVTPVQSARSGLPVYTPGGGIKSWGTTIGLDYEFIQQWILSVKLDYSRELGPVADSPLVRLRGTPNQFSGGTFISYSF
jgi:outer membrane scaffolding protein for murein synthesis (MipA/OmpV family)